VVVSGRIDLAWERERETDRQTEEAAAPWCVVHTVCGPLTALM